MTSGPTQEQLSRYADRVSDILEMAGVERMRDIFGLLYDPSITLLKYSENSRDSVGIERRQAVDGRMEISLSYYPIAGREPAFRLNLLEGAGNTTSVSLC